MIERHHRALFLLLFAVFIIYGMSMTIIGATLPVILADFQWNYLIAGFVLGAGAAGTLPAGQCVSEGTTTTSWGWLTLVDRPDASWYVTVESTLPPDVDVRVPGGLALPVSGDDLVAAGYTILTLAVVHFPFL